MMTGSRQNIILAVRRETINNFIELQDSNNDDDDTICSVSNNFKAGSVVGKYVHEATTRRNPDFPILVKYKVAPAEDPNCFLVLKVVRFARVTHADMHRREHSPGS